MKKKMILILLPLMGCELPRDSRGKQCSGFDFAYRTDDKVCQAKCVELAAKAEDPERYVNLCIVKACGGEFRCP